MPVRFNDTSVFPLIGGGSQLAGTDTLLIYDQSAAAVKQVQSECPKQARCRHPEHARHGDDGVM